MQVFVFPPRESFNKRVSFESLYGTNEPILFLSLRILIQFPSDSKLLLMLAPSTILCPLLEVEAALSLPARSMRDNLEYHI